MLKNYRYGATIIGSMLSCMVMADQRHCSVISPSNEFNKSLTATACDVTFSSIPIFTTICILGTESNTYTITNNSPAAIKINYIRVQINDSLPASTTTITAAPINHCGSSLAAGASCNILMNIVPTLSGALNRVLQIGVNSRQVELDAPAVAFTVCSTPPPIPLSTFDYSPTNSVQLDCTILGASTVTNTGASNVNGNVCLDPGLSITGFPPGQIINGGPKDNTSIEATTARTSFTTVQTYIDTLPCDTDLTGHDLGDLPPLTAGTYCFSSSAQLTGALTLNGSSAEYFYFKIGSTLTTASAASVVLTGGATSAHVFWDVGSSATIGTDTLFQGNILAQASTTITTGAHVSGKVLVGTGAVTLDTNAVSP